MENNEDLSNGEVYINGVKGKGFYVKSINGKEVNEEKIYLLSLPGEFEIVVENFDETAEYFNLCLYGKSKMAKITLNIYTMDNQYVGHNDMGMFIYYISIKKIYEMSGSPNFKVKVDKMVHMEPNEIFDINNSYTGNFVAPTVGIRVKQYADKINYLAGEKFDRTGLIVEEVSCVGETREITDYEIENEDQELIHEDRFIEIYYQQFSTLHPIKVIIQKIPVVVENYQRKRPYASYSEWELLEDDSNIEVYLDENVERKTVLKFNWENIKPNINKDQGIRIRLISLTKNTNLIGNKIRIDGVSYVIPDNREIYAYLGEIWEEKSQEQVVEITYDNANIKIEKTEQFDVFYCEARNQSRQEQSYSLSKKINLDVDIIKGESRFIITDLTATETWLGFEINHIIDPALGKGYYGNNVKLNVQERLELISDNTSVRIPMYTNGLGQTEIYQTLFYYFDNQNQKKYIEGKNKNDLMVDNMGILWYHQSKVYMRYIGSAEYMHFTNLPTVITSMNCYKKWMKNENNKHRPCHFLVVGNVYKGFDLEGDLVCVLNTYGQYFEYSYDSLKRITKIQDQLGNSLIFKYSQRTKLLMWIKDTNTENIVRYTYNADGSLKNISKNHIIEIQYQQMYHNGSSSLVISKIRDSKENKTYDISYDRPSRFSQRIKLIENTETKEKIKYEYEEELLRTIDNGTSKCIYELNQESKIQAFFKVEQNKVVEAFQFVYDDPSSLQKNVIQLGAEKKYLNQYSLEDFKEEASYDGIFCMKEYNDLYLIEKIQYANTAVKQNVTKSFYTEYGYDENRRIISELTQEIFYENSNMKVIIQKDRKYQYDSLYQVVTKKIEYVTYYHYGITEQSYTDVWEYLYDDFKGNKIEESYYRFNGHPQEDQIDVGNADKIFILEKKEFDEKNRIKKIFDNSCENGIRFTYADNKILPSKIIYGNEEIAYEYDQDQQITCIKGNLTDNINKNTITYIEDKIDTLNHSGNVLIQYIYDSDETIDIEVGGEFYQEIKQQKRLINGWDTYDQITTIDFNQNKKSIRSFLNKNAIDVYHDKNKVLEFEFDKFGNLIKEKNNIELEQKEYGYDDTGVCINTQTKKIGTEILTHKENYTYDIKGRITQKTITKPSSRSTIYTYQDYLDDCILKVKANYFQIEYEYDDVKRRTKKKIGLSNQELVKEEYKYYMSNLSTETILPKSITFQIKDEQYKEEIEYDEHMNVASISKDGVLKKRYFYDSLNRLVREDNQELNCSKKYYYDNNGNRIKEEEYHYRPDELYDPDETKVYHYDKDKIIWYNDKVVNYDSNDNIILYDGNNLSWNEHQELIRFNNNTYSYNVHGLRIKKNDNQYSYDEEERLLNESKGLEYYYDDSGIIGFTYKRNYYTYLKDILGNIKGIINSLGEVIANYIYDAWGNHEVVDNNGTIITDENHVGNINPFRYRGYYYDVETGLYYLKSRYYDPKMGRFISKDSIHYVEPEKLNGLNLYIYCNNNPIMYIDPEGTFSLLGLFIGLIIGAAIGFGAVAYEDFKDDGKLFNGSKTWQDYLLGTTIGGAVGAILGGYVIPALSEITFSIPTSFKLVADTLGGTHVLITSSVVITGKEVIVGAGTLAALVGLTYMFAKIPYQGKPNTTIKQGGSYGEYDSNGNLKYRVDTTGKAHYIKKYGKKYLPHIHKFTWKIVDGVWRFIEEIFPFL